MWGTPKPDLYLGMNKLHLLHHIQIYAAIRLDSFSVRVLKFPSKQKVGENSQFPHYAKLGYTVSFLTSLNTQLWTHNIMMTECSGALSFLKQHVSIKKSKCNRKMKLSGTLECLCLCVNKVDSDPLLLTLLFQVTVTLMDILYYLN